MQSARINEKQVVKELLSDLNRLQNNMPTNLSLRLLNVLSLCC